MTNLAATYFAAVEPDALAYAKKLVAWYRDKLSALSPESAHAFARQHLKQRAREHHDHMMRIKKAAEQGDADAREALLELCNEYENKGEGKPTPLGDFQMQWNKGLIPRRRARQKVSNSMRDIVIAMMVSEVHVKFGLPPTRRSARHCSCCSIIAIALASELPRGTIKPGEKAVETIWNEWSPLTVPFSALRIIP
jgi:hypothetical protein